MVEPGIPYSNEYVMQYIEEVAAYVRVSTTEQKMHGISIDAQKQKLEEYAENHNMKIVEWYIDEGVSGRKPIAKRPELQRMIHDAQKGKFKRIIFIKLDRFFRSLSEYHECMKLIDPVIWTATEEKYDLSTANGRAFVNMKLTIAELEADTGGERVKIVNDYKVKSGMPLYGAQCLPFCYTIQEGEKKSIVKKNQDIMEDALSYVMLHHSVSGALVYVKNKHHTKIGYKALLKAFRNEMICGSYRGNPNYCPPYITREMFDKLQTIVNRNPRTSQNEYSYIFSGLIRCPRCGNSMKGSFNVSNSRRYYGYRCDKSLRDKECDFKTIVFENRMERLMLERVEEYIEKQEIGNIEISEKERITTKVDVEELRAELDRLNYSWQKGRIKTIEQYDKQYDALMEKLELAEKEQHRTKTQDFEAIEAVLSSGWRDIYNALDDEHKKAFWRNLIHSIEVEWDTNVKRITKVNFL